jgi:hypothetical protein
MKTHKLKVTLNEIKRMQQLAGISALNEGDSVRVKVSKDDLVDFTIPDWALPTLINADHSHLTDEEEIELDNFVKETVSKYGNANFLLGDENDDDLGFQTRNSINNMGGDCHRLYIMPSK